MNNAALFSRPTPRFRHRQRRGVSAALFAFLLPVIVILAAFTINIAYMQLARTELRIATDAAARAGGRSLSVSQSLADARAAAVDAAAQNFVSGRSFAIDPSDVTFGTNARSSATGRFVFTPGPQDDLINALQVEGRKTADAPAGPVNLFLTGIIGRGTFETTKRATAMQLDRDIVLVLDRSGSMNTQNRFRNLRIAVGAFMDTLEETPPSEQVAMATFSTSSTVDELLTFDYDRIESTLGSKRAAGRTAIGLGMRSGDVTLQSSEARPFAQQTMVVMTDGRHNQGIDPETVARDLMRTNRRLTIHTVTFSSGADQARMRRVATIGQGKHFHADNGAELTEAFEEIAATVPTLLTD